MPALRLLGRKWLAASDDLVFPSIFELLFRFVWSPYDVVCLCKETLLNLNKWEYIIIILLLTAFLFGLIIGATSCKSQHGKFNSHLLTCIDNMLTFDSYTNDRSFHAIT